MKLKVTFLLLSCAVYCAAQAATGNIRGTISDSTGALLPNCSVTIANVTTGFTRTVKTNERGDFNAPSVPVGVYNVTVELTGFQKTVLSGVELHVRSRPLKRGRRTGPPTVPAARSLFRAVCSG